MLLAKLLRTLSEEEIVKIRKDFRLPERSQLLFERIAVSANAPPESETLAKAFRISQENLYRLSSEVVDECVRILAPREEFSTMNFFRKRYLYRPFVTEAHRTEKRLLHERNKYALEKFYKYVFMNMRGFPVDVIDLDLMQEYGNKWHRIKANPQIDDELYIRIRVIFVRIAGLPARKKMNLAQMSQYARQLLDPVAKCASSSLNPLARYEYYQSEWKACVYERTDPQIQIKWLQLSLEVIRENKSVFEPEREKVVELQIAYELATKCDKAKEGLATFRKYYHGQTPETSRGVLFLMQFIRVAFLAHDYATSRRMVEEIEKYQSVKTTPTIYINVLIARALLEVIEENADAALKTIEIAKVTNHENFFLAYEVQIRGLETVIALKYKDLDLADQLVERNIKWLRSRKISLSESAWIYFYQVIGSIIRYRITGEPIRTMLLDHLTNDFRKEHPEFFVLLESEIAELSGKTEKALVSEGHY